MPWSGGVAGRRPAAEQVKRPREGVRCHPPVGEGQRFLNARFVDGIPNAGTVEVNNRYFPGAMTAPREHRGRPGDVSGPDPSHFLAPVAGDPQVPHAGAPAPLGTPGRGCARRPGAGERRSRLREDDARGGLAGACRTAPAAPLADHGRGRRTAAILEAGDRGVRLHRPGASNGRLPGGDAARRTRCRPARRASSWRPWPARSRPSPWSWTTTTPTMACRIAASRSSCCLTICRRPSRSSSSAGPTRSCRCPAVACRAGSSRSGRRIWPSPLPRRQHSYRRTSERPCSVAAR